MSDPLGEARELWERVTALASRPVLPPPGDTAGFEREARQWLALAVAAARDDSLHDADYEQATACAAISSAFSALARRQNGQS